MSDSTVRNRIVRSDGVVPGVLHGTHCIAVDLGDGILPAPSSNTVAQIRASTSVRALPSWAVDFTLDVLARLTDLLRVVRPRRSAESFQFDLFHRIEDFALVGTPKGQQFPVLVIDPFAPFLSDSTGGSFIEAMTSFSTMEISNAHQHFKVELRKLSSFSPDIRTHRPELVIVESWRMITVFNEFQLGNPAGTITLAPGETREIEIKLTHKETRRSKNVETIIEKVTNDTTRDFQIEFSRQSQQTDSGSSSISWSQTDAADLLNSSRNRTTSGTKSLSVSKMANLVESTTDSIVEKVTRSREVTISKEFERTADETEETRRLVKLVSPSNDVGVTFVYHYLNSLSRVHVDLVGLAMVYTGASADDVPVRLPLTNSLKDSLEQVIAGDAAGRAYEAVLATLIGRYGDLDIAEGMPLAFALRGRPDGDVNDRLSSRAALLGERRTKGALPVCVRSFDRLIQTTGLHVEPIVSEGRVRPQGADGGNP